MGMTTLLTALENSPGIRTVGICLGEKSFGSRLSLNFRVIIPGSELDDIISVPSNVLLPDVEERYKQRWQKACEITPPDPFAYLGRSLGTDYTQNLPNAFYILEGWFQKLRLFQAGLVQKGLPLTITSIGMDHPFDEEKLALLERETNFHVYDHSKLLIGDYSP